MTCCNCWNDFTNYIKSFFVKNEEQIKSEMNHLVNGIIPIILPIIKQQIEDIINQRIPLQFQIPVDNVINKVL